MINPEAQEGARREPTVPQKVHHYTHVVCALCEGLKAIPADPSGPSGPAAALAIDATIAGVCKLIDSLVASELPRSH